jgi:hypothetical protein
VAGARPPGVGATRRGWVETLTPGGGLVRAMPTYRAYLVNPAGKITWGEWFDAPSLEAAERVARSRCQPGIPRIELWEGARRVGTVDCGRAAGEAAGAGPGPAPTASSPGGRPRSRRG